MLYMMLCMTLELHFNSPQISGSLFKGKIKPKCITNTQPIDTLASQRGLAEVERKEEGLLWFPHLTASGYVTALALKTCCWGGKRRSEIQPARNSALATVVLGVREMTAEAGLWNYSGVDAPCSQETGNPLLPPGLGHCTWRGRSQAPEDSGSLLAPCTSLRSLYFPPDSNRFPCAWHLWGSLADDDI